MKQTKISIVVLTFSLVFGTSNLKAECYFNTSRYWAVTEGIPIDNSMSHQDFIDLENSNGRPIDGVLINNNLFLLNDEHPVDKVRFTEGYCRMFLPKQKDQQGYFRISPFSAEPEIFTEVLYVRFECELAPTCAFDETQSE